jgi:hypothetical protein
MSGHEPNPKMDNLVNQLIKHLSMVDYASLRHETGIHNYSYYLSRERFAALRKEEIQYHNKAEQYDTSYNISFVGASEMLEEGRRAPDSEYEADSISECAEILRKMSERACQIHKMITSSTEMIMKSEIWSDEIKDRINQLDCLFSQPSTASRPFHLHYTQNSAGGGNYLEISNQLKKNYRFLPVNVPESWIVSKDEAKVLPNILILRVRTNIVAKMLDDGFIKEACFESMRIAKIIQAVGFEADELFLEVTAWKKLQCALGMHSRLGEKSPLRLLNQDLMKMILEF